MMADDDSVARAFGTALVQGFQPYHWIYCQSASSLLILSLPDDDGFGTSPPFRADPAGLGPTIGAFLASAFYVFLRYIQYWYVSPHPSVLLIPRQAIPPLSRCLVTLMYPGRSIPAKTLRSRSLDLQNLAESCAKRQACASAMSCLPRNRIPLKVNDSYDGRVET